MATKRRVIDDDEDQDAFRAINSSDEDDDGIFSDDEWEKDEKQGSSSLFPKMDQSYQPLSGYKFEHIISSAISHRDENNSDVEGQLLNAMECRHRILVEEYANVEIDPNAPLGDTKKYPDPMNFMCIAAKNDRIDMFSFFHKFKNGDLSEHNRDRYYGMCPLEHALRAGANDIIEYILSVRGDYADPTKLYRTTLNVISNEERLEADKRKRLEKANAQPVVETETGTILNTHQLSAVIDELHQEDEMFREQKKRSSNNNNGDIVLELEPKLTLLGYALYTSNSRLTKLLLSTYKVSPMHAVYGGDIPALDFLFRYCPESSETQSTMKNTNLLLEHGADINHTDSQQHKTPMHHMCQWFSNMIVTGLFYGPIAGMYVNWDARDSTGLRPWEYINKQS